MFRIICMYTLYKVKLGLVHLFFFFRHFSAGRGDIKKYLCDFLQHKYIILLSWGYMPWARDSPLSLTVPYLLSNHSLSLLSLPEFSGMLPSLWHSVTYCSSYSPLDHQNHGIRYFDMFSLLAWVSNYTQPPSTYIIRILTYTNSRY